MPTTTRWRRASSPRSSVKCSTGVASRARPKRRWRFSIGWKVGTTHIADTPRWVVVRPSTTSAMRCRARRPDMWPPTSHGLIWRGIALAGTPAIAAPGASYAVDFSRRLKNDELLPPAVADSPTGKIDEHREEESSELRRQAVHGSGATPLHVSDIHFKDLKANAVHVLNARRRFLARLVQYTIERFDIGGWNEGTQGNYPKAPHSFRRFLEKWA